MVVSGPPLSKGRRVWTWVVLVCALLGVGAAGWLVSYRRIQPVWGAFVILVLLCAAGASILALWPMSLRMLVEDFCRRLAVMASLLCIFGLGLLALTVAYAYLMGLM